MAFTRKHEFLVTCARVFIDIFCILLAYAIAVLGTLPENQTWIGYAYNRLIYLVVFIIVWCGAAADQRLFVSRRSEALVALLFSVAKAFFSSVLFSAFLMALFLRDGVDRGFFGVFAAAVFVAVVAFRLAMRLSLWNLRRRGYNYRQILIIGANERTAHLVEVFLANEQYGYHVDGFLEDDQTRRPILERYNVPCLGDIKELEKLLVNRVIDGVYVSLPVRSFYETIENVAHLCEGVGVPVRFVADLFPLRMATSDLARLGDVPLLSLAYEPELQTRFALKRAMDVAASCILLVTLAPLFLAVAILIKLDSRGPVFSSRERVGWDLRPFKAITFRTVAVRREGGDKTRGQGERPRAGLDAAREDGPPTRVGKYLRRYGLDQLPQLVNILLGQMNLVGPGQSSGHKLKVDSPV